MDHESSPQGKNKYLYGKITWKSKKKNVHTGQRNPTRRSIIRCVGKWKSTGCIRNSITNGSNWWLSEIADMGTLVSVFYRDFRRTGFEAFDLLCWAPWHCGRLTRGSSSLMKPRAFTRLRFSAVVGLWIVGFYSRQRFSAAVGLWIVGFLFETTAFSCVIVGNQQKSCGPTNLRVFIEITDFSHGIVGN